MNDLALGGAQRVTAAMANYYAMLGWETFVITFDNQPSLFELHPNVQRISLAFLKESKNALSGVLNNITRLAKLRKAILATHPDVVISLMTRPNILTLAAMRFSSIPVIVSERVDPRVAFEDKGWRFLRWLTYPWADRLIVQTIEAASFFKNHPGVKISIIPNFVQLQDQAQGIQGIELPQPCVVSMGRLTLQKDFASLIHAFSLALQHNTGWFLAIAGDGELRQELEALRDKLGLHAQVIMTGYLQCTEAFLKQGKIYVQSSRYEGFPNALCEAMACGLPAISFDCPSGPSAIIRHAVDGILVPPGDIQALAEALSDLMQNQDKRQSLGAEAATLTERLSLKHIMTMWNTSIEEAIRNKKPRGLLNLLQQTKRY